MTPTEIVKHLRKSCHDCNPTPCCEFEVLGSEAADLIETLTARAEVAEKMYATVCEGKCKVDAELAIMIARTEQAEAKLKEAVRELWIFGGCKTCKHCDKSKYPNNYCDFGGCNGGGTGDILDDRWQWRGESGRSNDENQMLIEIESEDTK